MSLTRFDVCCADGTQNKIRAMAYPELLVSRRKEHLCRVGEDQNRREKSFTKLLRISSIGIRRHVKIKAAANPYDPEYAAYFWRRRHDRESKLFTGLVSPGISGHEGRIGDKQPGRSTRAAFRDA